MEQQQSLDISFLQRRFFKAKCKICFLCPSAYCRRTII